MPNEPAVATRRVCRAGVDRRGFLTSLGRLALGGAGSVGLHLTPARAAGAHTFAHGEFEITVISDGHLTLPPEALARNIEPSQLAAVLQLGNRSAVQVSAPTNVTLVKTKSDLILIDTGAGPNFMPTAGKLLENMATAGIDRKKVTKVVFTHGHPDHLWGTIDEFEDALAFPTASYVISAVELDLWMADDVLSKVPADRQNFAPGAKRNLSRIKHKVRTVKPGEDIVTGIRTMDTGGHTQGHISIEIAGSREALVVLGDALTHPVISFTHPDWKPASDHEPDRGVATRRKLLDRLVVEKNSIIGYHLPFPGLGRVERKDGAYAFLPMS